PKSFARPMVCDRTRQCTIPYVSYASGRVEHCMATWTGDRRVAAVDSMITTPGQVKQTLIAAEDDTDRVTGALRFAVHRRIAGSAYVCAVRSSAAHARILEIDATEALNLPGVLAVITGADALDLLGKHLFH